jgi:glucose-6-phosphate isomerase
VSATDPAAIARRVWAREPALWHADPKHHEEISIRLGWLDSPSRMREKAGEMAAFAAEIRDAGFTHALLLGMGGSSLAPEVFRLVFPRVRGTPELAVMDTTDPGAIRAAGDRAAPDKTLVIVSSKSGSTIEVASLLGHFLERAGGRGDRFIAITDPGTGLEETAKKNGFRRIFTNQPDIGGRYSALSYFGLVPAALLGAGLEGLLDSALAMVRACGPSVPSAGNPGLVLGLRMGEAAKAGRDKVTLVLDRAIAPFGLWVEQLIAESTGKEGRGIVPVAGERLGPPEAYGPDRLFVRISVGSGDGGVEERLGDLEKAGHPVVRLNMPGLVDLGAEMFRWEFATAVAGAVMAIDPFDQPNVQEAKDRTRAILAGLKPGGSIPEPAAADPWKAAGELLRGLKRGRDYLALLAFLPFGAEYEESFDRLRVAVGDRRGVATTFGFGPRYLHSTGQLHKGGAGNGAFMVVTCDHAADLPVPGQPYTFAQLERAQAMGDIESLIGHGRRVVRFHLPSPAPKGVAELCDRLAKLAGS